MTWSHRRLGTALALLIWAVTFWFLMLSERTPFYFSSRTTWLAPLGAVTLTLALIGRAATAKSSSHEPLAKAEILRTAFLVLPALAVLLLPPPTLGSFAVGRGSTSIGRGAFVAAVDRDVSTGDLSLVDVFSLIYNDEMGRLTERAGSTVSFTGFVGRKEGMPADEFVLNRFMISCCPGDAVGIQVRVVGAPPGRFRADDWVRVTGAMYPLGEQVVVDAAQVTPVPRPRKPYLNSV